MDVTMHMRTGTDEAKTTLTKWFPCKDSDIGMYYTLAIKKENEEVTIFLDEENRQKLLKTLAGEGVVESKNW